MSRAQHYISLMPDHKQDGHCQITISVKVNRRRKAVRWAIYQYQPDGFPATRLASGRCRNSRRSERTTLYRQALKAVRQAMAGKE